MTIDRAALLAALRAVKPAVPSKAVLPVLECALLSHDGDALTVAATDLTARIEADAPASGDPAAFCVDYGLLLKWAQRQTKDEVRLDHADGWLTLRGNGRTRVPTFPAADFPAADDGEPRAEVVVDGAALAELKGALLAVTSKDALRPAMMEVCFDTGHMVATDGHRLVALPVEGGPEAAFTVPPVVVEAVPEAGAHAVALSQSGTVALALADGLPEELTGLRVRARTVGELFPNWSAVVPTDNDRRLTVETADLLGAVDRALLAASGVTHQVKFTASAAGLVVEAEDIESGKASQETVACEWDAAEPLVVGWNGAYVADLCKNVGWDRMEWSLSTPNRAAIIREAGVPDGAILILMPVMLNTHA